MNVCLYCTWSHQLCFLLLCLSSMVSLTYTPKKNDRSASLLHGAVIIIAQAAMHISQEHVKGMGGTMLVLVWFLLLWLSLSLYWMWSASFSSSAWCHWLHDCLYYSSSNKDNDETNDIIEKKRAEQITSSIVIKTMPISTWEQQQRCSLLKVLSSLWHELQATTKAHLSLAAGYVHCPAICIDFCKCHQYTSMEGQDLPCTHLAHEPESIDLKISILLPSYYRCCYCCCCCHQ